jgi:2-methylaconitate cis-trans-isomerase PrpF
VLTASSGSNTGALLPTSNPIDTIDGIRVSCIDVGNPCVFVAASSLSVKGTIAPDEIESSPPLLAKLESIRRGAAVRMGIAKSPDTVPGSIPKVAIVSEGHAGQYDLAVRSMSVGQPHRAVPITVALALASATKLDGTIPFQISRRSTERAGGSVDEDGVTLGHATGSVLVTANMADGRDGKTTVSDATVFRTARLLMKGQVFWKD